MGYELGFVPLDMDVSASVNSVFGRTGAVAATTGDYTAAQVTNAADKSSSSTQAFTGSITANSASVGGSITGSAITGTTGTFSGNLLANSASVSGPITGTAITGTTGTFSSNVLASSASVSGNYTGYNGNFFGAIGVGSLAASVSGTFDTEPPASASVAANLNGTLALGTPFQNTLSYDINVTIFLSITVNTSGVLKLGVGPTNTPVQNVILSGVTTVGFVAVKFKLPSDYWALLSISGTVTDSIAGQFIEAA